MPSLFQRPKPAAVVGDEDQQAVQVREIPRRRIVRAGADVPHEHGAGGGAVTFPKFRTGGSPAAGTEIERAVDVDQVRGPGALAEGVELADDKRAGAGAVAAPKTLIAAPGGRRKIDDAVDVGEVVGA